MPLNSKIKVNNVCLERANNEFSEQRGHYPLYCVGMNVAPEKKRIYPCYLMELESFCAALDRADLPGEGKWRALIRFMHGGKNYLPVSGAERVAMQNHMMKLL